MSNIVELCKKKLYLGNRTSGINLTHSKDPKNESSKYSAAECWSIEKAKTKESFYIEHVLSRSHNGEM